MADTLLFRGGNTADVNSANTTVNDREIVIDTQTNQVVLGSAKDRTVMASGATGRVGIGIENPGENLTVGGEDNPTIRLHTAENGDNWSTSSQYGRLQFYSNDYEYNSGGEMASISAGVNNSFGQTPSIRFSTTTPRSAGAVPTERMRLQGSTLMLGGTLPSSPNISLSANGQGDFAGGNVVLKSGSGYSSVEIKNTVQRYSLGTDGATNNLRVYNNTSSTTFSSWRTNGDFYHGGGSANGTDISTPNIRLNANGSAEFSSGVTADYFATNTTTGFFNFYRNQGATSALNSVWGTTGGAQTIKFYNDGASEFAGQAVVGSNTAGASKVRIDPTGYVNIQSNASAGEALRIYDNSSTLKTTLKADGTASFEGGISASDTGATVLTLTRKEDDSNNRVYVKFLRVGSQNLAGDIKATKTTVSYNTSSDYRLKENVVDIEDGITRVKQLQPKRFNFIADADRTLDGFIAHEAQTVVPEAVSGTKDEVDDDGNAVIQGIDQSKLVPLLTAALQEAIAKIETLEAKVSALEAN